MGKRNSKFAHTPSFDQVKSIESCDDIWEKNQPIDFHSSSSTVEENSSASNDKSSVRLVENMVLIWLDATSEQPTDNTKKLLAYFLRICNLVRPFNESKKALDFTRTISREKILFVVSGSLGPEILPHINHLEQIYSIYIFCGQKSNHIEWSKPYNKIHGIHTQIKDLCDALKYDSNQYDKSLTAISLLPYTSHLTLDSTNKQFICLQVMKSILLEIDYDSKFRRELVDYTRPIYRQNPQQDNMIETFEINYPLHSPIWWYTRKCFIYRMLRKAFYQYDFEIIYKLAFFIRDLHRDIKKSYLQIHSCQYHPICLYRSARITKTEFEQVEQNQNGLLAFNDFVIATLERVIALKFAQKLRNDPHTIAVIYKIDIDPAKSSIPFVAFQNLGYMSNNNGEILLSMNTIFHIELIEKVVDRLYEITLVPANKKDAQILNLVEYMQELTCGLPGWYKLSKIMMEVDEYDQVEHIYKYVYDQIEDNQRAERAYILHELGYICSLKKDYSSALYHYRRALEIYSNYLPNDHQTIFSTHINLAGVLEKQGNLNEALTHYQQALKVDKSNDLLIIVQYNKIGKLLQKLGKNSDAQQQYMKVIDTLHRDFPLPSAQKYLADSYFNLAGLLYSTKDYTQSLNYYDKILKMDEKTSSSLASLYFNLATTYDGMKNGNKAMEYAGKSIESGRLAYGDNHQIIKDNCAYLEHLQKKYSSSKK